MDGRRILWESRQVIIYRLYRLLNRSLLLLKLGCIGSGLVGLVNLTVKPPDCLVEVGGAGRVEGHRGQGPVLLRKVDGETASRDCPEFRVPPVKTEADRRSIDLAAHAHRVG